MLIENVEVVNIAHFQTQNFSIIFPVATSTVNSAVDYFTSFDVALAMFSPKFSLHY